MLFNSPYYIFAFLPITLILYFLLNRLSYTSIAKIWLVLASLFFYGYWNVNYLILIIASMLVNFFIGYMLHKTRKNEQKPSFVTRKVILIIGILFNISLLAYYKYSDFVISNISSLFDTDLPMLNLLLPLAISFFTFQQIAYLVDCYKTDTQEYKFLNYCLFVTFFPQLIAGPIVHHKEMMPQFSNVKNKNVNNTNIAKGLFIFSIGLFKKVVIADTFAIWANKGFEYAALEKDNMMSFIDAWGTSLSYTFQLYYDFSAYTDMAIGAALMFNILLPKNFNSPYKALDIQDFWRRWHMTLSRWLRDYVYIPLGGNRKGAYFTYANLMFTFVIGGLWHGAAWTFVLWGALHGIAIIIHRLWQQLGFKLIPLVSWLLTFLFVNFTWVIFRANDMSSAMYIIETMLGLNGVNMVQIQTSANTLIFIFLFGIIAFFAKNSLEIGLNKMRFSIKDSLFVSLTLFASIVLGIATTSSKFLYFNF
jgi:alginate O-acetyltransferase complex protein AlgI